MQLVHDNEEKHKRRLLTLDHIVPVSRGGTSIRSNLQTMCRVCNNKKGNRVKEEVVKEYKERNPRKKILPEKTVEGFPYAISRKSGVILW